MLQNFDRHFEKYHNFETDYLKILYYDLSKDHKEIYRSYQYNRLCTIVSGTKHVKINNGEEFEYTHSEFILLPPHSSVDMEIKENTIAIVYEMSDKLIEDTQKRIQIQQQRDFSISKNTIVKETFNKNIESPLQRINHYCMGNDPNKTFLIDLCSQELIYNLMKDYYISLSHSNDQLDPVHFTMQFLKENIYENITISQIAQQLNMSPSNLIACFKKRTNMTPKEYQNLLKLKTSKEALKYKNVTEVCYDLGFENVSYFIKLFKNFYGETPKQFAMRIHEI